MDPAAAGGAVGVAPAAAAAGAAGEDTGAGSAAAVASLPQRSKQHAVSRLRSRHRDGALALLRASLLRGDYATAAGAAAALLRADSYGALDARELLGPRTQRRTARRAEVVWACLDLLRRHGTSNEQLRRFLRRAAHLFAPLPAERDGALRELAVVLWQQGDVPQAYDVLCSGATGGGATAAPRSSGGVAAAFRTAALQGVLRHRQWLTALGGPGPSLDAAGVGVMGLPLRTGLGRGAAQGAAEAWAKDAERHLKEALNLCPRATWVTLLLAQLQLGAGRLDTAVQLARAAAAASPSDADAAKLMALLLEQQLVQHSGGAAAGGVAGGGGGGSGGVAGGRQTRRRGRRGQDGAADGSGAAAADAAGGGSGGAAAARAHALRDECLRAVQLDPWAYGALSVLSSSAGHCAFCSAALAEALLLHLDVAGLTDYEAAADCSTLKQQSEAADTLNQPGTREAAAAAADGGDFGPSYGPTAPQAAAVETAARFGPWGAAALALGRLAAAAAAELAGAQGTTDPSAQQQQQQQAAEALGAWRQRVAQALDARRGWWSEAMSRPSELQSLAALTAPEASAAAAGAAAFGSGQGSREQEGSAPPTGLPQPACVAVCRAAVLAFVCGAEGGHAPAVLQLLQRAAAAAGGGPQSMEVDGNEEDPGEEEQQEGSEGGSGKAAKSSDTLLSLLAGIGDWTVSACAAALEHAGTLGGALAAHCEQCARAEAAAARVAAPKPLLGPPSDTFGALLDLPLAWWAAFPPKRRRLLTQGAAGGAAAPTLGGLLREELQRQQQREEEEGGGGQARERRAQQQQQWRGQDSSSDSDEAGISGVPGFGDTESLSGGSSSDGGEVEEEEEDGGSHSEGSRSGTDSDSSGSGGGRSQSGSGGSSSATTSSSSSSEGEEEGGRGGTPTSRSFGSSWQRGGD